MLSWCLILKIKTKSFGEESSVRLEVTIDRRKLYKEECHDSCVSTNVIRVVKPRRIIWWGI